MRPATRRTNRLAIEGNRASPQSPTVAQDAARVVDEVVVLDQGDYQPETALSALGQVCRQLSPNAVLFGNDTYSQEITPRLAHRLGGSAVGDVVDITVHENALRVYTASVWWQGPGSDRTQAQSGRTLDAVPFVRSTRNN
jgi:electron transfer flavoprotein alpha subunit